jgi:hypothetical protein
MRRTEAATTASFDAPSGPPPAAWRRVTLGERLLKWEEPIFFAAAALGIVFVMLTNKGLLPRPISLLIVIPFAMTFFAHGLYLILRGGAR